jgi:hypothetical protein
MCVFIVDGKVDDLLIRTGVDVESDSYKTDLKKAMIIMIIFWIILDWVINTQVVLHVVTRVRLFLAWWHSIQEVE